MSLIAKLRRIALERQGLLRKNSFGRGKGATLRAIEHLGYVQIDTIAVVERAHHHVLFSRVSNYRPAMLDRLVRERRVFEYWYHAAAWLPMRDYRFALPRMAKMHGDRNWFPDADRKLQREILARIRAEGPLKARDFEDPDHDSGGWWEWKPAKQSLEQLFMQGELMVSGRNGFQKLYDLPERVLPDWVETRPPTLAEYAAYLVDSTLRAHGFATQKSITYLRKGRDLRQAVRAELERRIADGTLIELDCDQLGLVYADPEPLERRAPPGRAQVRILSPFDNCVIQRERTRGLFDFDFQIECYVPEDRRRFGYFCLPILYRDRFVGRIDCKARRRSSRFEIRALHLERDVDSQFDVAFESALEEFARFNGCQSIDGRSA